MGCPFDSTDSAPTGSASAQPEQPQPEQPQCRDDRQTNARAAALRYLSLDPLISHILQAP